MITCEKLRRQPRAFGSLTGMSKIFSDRFSRYRVPRFSDLPALETVLMDHMHRKDAPPSGAGETPIVALAPALGNALFDATGLRLRALPLAPKGMIAGSRPAGTP